MAQYDSPRWSYFHGCDIHKGQAPPCTKCIAENHPDVIRLDQPVVVPAPEVSPEDVYKAIHDWNCLSVRPLLGHLPPINIPPKSYGEENCPQNQPVVFRLKEFTHSQSFRDAVDALFFYGR